MPDAEQVAVAIYNTHDEAEQAVKTLERGGFDMKKLSIVGKDYHTEEHVVGYYNTGDSMKAWGRIGDFWGGVRSLLYGADVFILPGTGTTGRSVRTYATMFTTVATDTAEL